MDSLGIELLKIIRADEESLQRRARSLISQAKIKLTDESVQQNFIELIEKILGEALLDFHQEQDLCNWLSSNN